MPAVSLQEPAAAVDSQGRRHSASLHPSSQAAQPTESGSQSGKKSCAESMHTCCCAVLMLMRVDCGGFLVRVVKALLWQGPRMLHALMAHLA